MPEPQLVRLRLGEVAELELDNPPMNLVTAELTQELRSALKQIAADPQVRAVVLLASGDRAFCAGSHVGEFEGLVGRASEGKLLLEQLVYRQLAELHVPTIAAIEADAFGGGLELALCCDLRVTAAGVRFGMPEVRLGVTPGSGGTQRLPRIIGPARAKEFIFTGEFIDAQEAERIGLVNRVVEPGAVRDKARELANTIASRGPLAVQATKRLIDLSTEVSLDTGIAAEIEESERIFATEDLLEGARAFFEKRPPVFRGR